MRPFRVQSITPALLGPDAGSVLRLAGAGDPLVAKHLSTEPTTVSLIVAEDGVPVWQASLFVARCARRSRGVTGDTARTYAESLAIWLTYLRNLGRDLSSADEELLARYRAHVMNSPREDGTTYASATANLRVSVVIQFHIWSQRHGYPSALGRYLIERDANDRSFSPRVIKRSPRVLSEAEISSILKVARPQFRLMFRWAVVTGMRRLEVAGLRRSCLPSPGATAHLEDGLASIEILRKGGRQQTVHVPVSLIEETQWHLIADRPEAKRQHNDFVFISNRGAPYSRATLTAEFGRCAAAIASEATLHHLRHTFACSVLNTLQRRAAQGADVNPLKTLQILLGHANSQTSERYVEALQISSPEVIEALAYLYGATA